MSKEAKSRIVSAVNKLSAKQPVSVKKRNLDSLLEAIQTGLTQGLSVDDIVKLVDREEKK